MKEKTEIRSSDHDLVTISITGAQLAELDSIARDAGSRFITVVDGGFRFQERTITDLLATIVSWEKTFYRWKDGKKKEIAQDLDDQEAREQGFKPGAELRLLLQSPEEFRGVEASLSLPVSSYLNFAAYARHLLNNKSTPAHVITRLGTLMRQFKIGAPVPVVTFRAIDFVEGAGGGEASGGDGKRGSSESDLFESDDSDEAWGE